MTNADSNKRLPSDEGSPRSVSPPPQQQPQQTENGTARRRKRTKKLKDKTYMNDEGFMGKCGKTPHLVIPNVSNSTPTI